VGQSIDLNHRNHGAWRAFSQTVARFVGAAYLRPHRVILERGEANRVVSSGCAVNVKRKPGQGRGPLWIQGRFGYHPALETQMDQAFQTTTLESAVSNNSHGITMHSPNPPLPWRTKRDHAYAPPAQKGQRAVSLRCLRAGH